MNKIQSTLKKMINWLALGAIIVILFSVIAVNVMVQNWLLVFINGIAMAVAILLWKRLEKRSFNISQKRVDLIFVIGIIGFIIVQYLFIVVFKIHPSFDFAWMYNMAYRLAQNQSLLPEHLAYLYNYPFNYSLLVVYQYIFQNIAFNLDYLFYLGMLCTSSTVVIVYFIFRNNFKPQVTLMLMVPLLLFYPYISYALIPYSDTIALPFFGLAILTCYKGQTVQTSFRAILLMSIAIMFGGQFKVLLLIIAIAYMIYVVLCHNYKIILLALLPFVMYFLGNNIFGNYVTSQNYSYASYQVSGMTPLYWVYAGLNYDAMGRYNENDYNESLQFGIRLTNEEKSEVTNFYLKGIQKRLQISPIKLIELSLYKVNQTWGNGTYGMNEYIILNPINQGKTRMFFTEGFGAILITCFTQFIQLLLLVGIYYRFKKKSDSDLFLKLLFLGFFSYLLIFEAGPRYILLLSPILFLINGENIDSNEL